jgi:hypothetical protein
LQPDHKNNEIAFEFFRSRNLCGFVSNAENVINYRLVKKFLIYPYTRYDVVSEVTEQERFKKTQKEIGRKNYQLIDVLLIVKV